MNTYFTPLLDITENISVWSKYTFTESTTVANTRFVAVLLGSVVVGMGICVDTDFFIVWFNFPCAVSADFGEYLCTRFDVNPVQDWKNLLLR